MQTVLLGLQFGVVIYLVLSCWSILFHLFSTLRKKRAPFVPSARCMSTHLLTLLQPDTKSTVYDLGCGEGRILRALYRRYPSARYIGIENDIYPYLLARLLNWKIPSSRLTIKCKNFFKEDLSPATHIVTYLFPEVMDQLLPKLEQELRPGTTLISFDFPFTHKEPEQVITNTSLNGHRLFVYRF